MNVEHYRWKNRLLLLFAPSEDEPLFQRQYQNFVGREVELEQRDMLVLPIIGANDGAEEARSQFHVGPTAFVVMLIGKDGTVKRRSEQPVALDDIFAQVDSMPMRQGEMRERAE